MMKFGTETGSIINHIMSTSVANEVTVGMPATLLSWSDRHPATVSKIFKKGKFEYITVTEDDYELVGEPKEYGAHCEYTFTTNPNNCTRTFKMVDGKAQAVYLDSTTGRYKKTDGNVIFGRREKYRDPSF